MVSVNLYCAVSWYLYSENRCIFSTDLKVKLPKVNVRSRIGMLIFEVFLSHVENLISRGGGNSVESRQYLSSADIDSKKLRRVLCGAASRHHSVIAKTLLLTGDE